jgi:ClpP class serine protease
LTRVKAALNDNPLTAGAENVFTSNQKEAYTRAVSKTMGSDASAITPDVINKAKNRIGKVYDNVLENISINPALHDKAQNVNTLYFNLNDIKNEARKILTDEGQFKSLVANIDDIVKAAQINNGQITGSQYKNIKNILDKISMGTDPAKSDLRHYSREIRDSLNEALTISAQKAGRTDLVDQLKNANKQWGNMRKIEDVALKSESGEVSPSLLYNSLTSKSKRHAFYADDPELAKLAQAGKIVLPSKTPNSGTVARLAAQAAPAAVGSGLYGLYEGDLGGAAKGAALGYALPKAAQMAINNPAIARYLEEGVKNVPIRTMLQTPKNIAAQKIAPATFNSYLQGRRPLRIEVIGGGGQQ